MTDADPEDPYAARSVAMAEAEHFGTIQRLHNHWSRPYRGPAYYWYLTFEDCADLHTLASRVRDSIPFPYYDFTPPESLHMTLDRIALEAAVSPRQVQAIAAAAALACGQVSPFDLNIGGLGGTPGALGLSAFPRGPVQRLRDTVRAATLSTNPDAPVKESAFHPHVALAYCNADVPASDAVTAVRRLSTLQAVTVRVTHVSLVLLARDIRSYSWQAVTRIAL